MATARSLIRALPAKMRRLKKDRTGNVATMFAIVIIPMMAFVGAAVDFSNAYRVKSRVQQALDAASLAVNRSIHTMDMADLEQLAKDIYAANLEADQLASPLDVTIDKEKRIVVLNTDARIDTFFMGLFGIDQMNVAASSKTVAGDQRLEIAMVLDNSGSMRGSKIDDLRDAAETLVNVLFADKTVSETVKVGIVPFAASVNVGPQYRNASWIDSAGISPVHSENFSEPVNRFDLYDNFSNERWDGCVELRPYPLDVRDTSPDPGAPKSYFVPMFAPDEPDDSRQNAYRTLNNYIDDQFSGSDRNRDWTWDNAQGNVAKYYAGVSVDSGDGPNYNCTTTPITPLTNQKSDISLALSRMQANGMTNIQSGLMWGWRVISPQSPFSEGVSMNDKVTIKVIILMSDGANTHRGINSPNKSMYSAYGYARNGRLGSPTSHTNTLVDRMNERTQEACTNAKAENVLLYTVAFGINDNVTRTLLRNCATNSNMAFTPDNGSDLIANFEQIGAEISALRIAE